MKQIGDYMYRKINVQSIVGQKYNRLTIKSYSHKDSKHGDHWYDCVCDCGKSKKIRRYHIMSGHAQSCGCRWFEVKKKPYKQASFDSLYQNYIRHARDREVEFGLTKEQFRNITIRHCAYCNRKPMQGNHKNSRHYGLYIHNGIDRVDNNLGYTIDNCVPCCKVCNAAKTTLTLQDFKEWIFDVYHHLELGGSDAGWV